jgi:hypothetical protein
LENEIGRAHSHQRDNDARVESAIDRIGVAMDAALSRRCRGEKIETHTIKAGIKAVTSSEMAP